MSQHWKVQYEARAICSYRSEHTTTNIRTHCFMTRYPFFRSIILASAARANGLGIGLASTAEFSFFCGCPFSCRSCPSIVIAAWILCFVQILCTCQVSRPQKAFNCTITSGRTRPPYTQRMNISPAKGYGHGKQWIVVDRGKQRSAQTRPSPAFSGRLR